MTSELPQMFVLYHANCYDGFGAAWAAWTALGDDGVAYFPVSYGDPLPDIPDGAIVVIADFSYPREVLLALKARCPLTVLDHHKTAQANLAGLPFAHFDMEKSGAMLAWGFWHPDDVAPLLIEYLQDRDLWRFALPVSRHVSAYVQSFPFEFALWSELAEDLAQHMPQVVSEGGAILRAKEQMVRSIADHARPLMVGGHRVHVANASVYFSEVGEELCRRYPDEPFGGYFLDRADGKRQWGLRSRGGFDVSEVAKQYGGGGHPGAAGFVTDSPEPLAT